MVISMNKKAQFRLSQSY